MLTSLGLLMQSRKFWVGSIAAIASIVGGVGLLMGKLTPAGYAAFVSGTAGPAIALIMGIAWEDASKTPDERADRRAP